MRKILFVGILFFLFKNVNSQTPINMSAQAGYTYTETFSDIANWTFNTSPSNGTFTSGIGASAWRGNDIGGTLAVPDASKITTASTAFQTPPSGSGGYSAGVYKGTQNMVLLSTGTTDNTTSIAMDFFLDFTGINANNLSFDWAVLNNSTGNRAGSLRIYASTDGVSFIEITSARVSNFINNNTVNVSGSINNVSLPSSFNNSATARLRFYYYNGVGGTTGSRPRLSIDNVKVTAVPSNPCASPTAQPTAFVANSLLNNAVQFSFTHASPQPNNYLVVMSNNISLSSLPKDSVTYNIGDNLGDGNVVAITNNNSVSISGLTPSTTYHFFIFSMNNSCTGGPLYLKTNDLRGNITTLSGTGNCISPTAQPTQLQFSNVTLSSITGNFTAAFGTDEYLVVRTTSTNFTGTINNGTLYSGGQVLGNGSVVTRTAGTNFISNNLTNGTKYYFFVFGLNRLNCNNGPAYLTTNPLKDSVSTVALPVCTTPSYQPTALNLLASNKSVNGYFTASTSADGYLIVRSINSSLSSNPIDGTNYTSGNSLGGGTVIFNQNATSFVDVGLNVSTTYYYFIFSRNSNCTGGIKYLSTLPLTGNITTSALATTNIYYGNLHAHSYYSDGNKDNPSYTPSDDFAYAKNSLCLDFLGISEHNHLTAGLNINNWSLGINQANAATTSTFLALYGMEWGVISNGGHVLVYGTNQLLGWETNNYNTYVPKSNYIGTPETNGTTGLFRTINNFGGNTFASLAHPNSSDFENIAYTNFNATADSAIVGCAIASGPAFSTNTSYTDFPSSFGYIDYYQRMLARGYHIAPSMDHDNHNTTFGRTNYNRLAVVAPTLTNTDFFAAMKGRNFYATEDCDTRINFTVNNQIMGSIIAGTNSPSISVYAIDPTNSASVPTIKLMYGLPGSNVVATEIASTSGNTLNYTDAILTNGTTAYYYVDITIAGNRSISAPIWYTKNGVTPLQFLNFTASLNKNNIVDLQWITSNEKNTLKFIIEKSNDGVNFKTINEVDSKNNYSTENTYSSQDVSPNNGINYYRLKQVDIDGRYSYSKIISISIDKVEVNTFSVYPNPVNDILNLNINSKNNEKANIIIHDLFGRLILSETIFLQKGKQFIRFNSNKLKPGNYVISMKWSQELLSSKILKLF